MGSKEPAEVSGGWGSDRGPLCAGQGGGESVRPLQRDGEQEAAGKAQEGEQLHRHGVHMRGDPHCPLPCPPEDDLSSSGH